VDSCGPRFLLLSRLGHLFLPRSDLKAIGIKIFVSYLVIMVGVPVLFGILGAFTGVYQLDMSEVYSISSVSSCTRYRSFTPTTPCANSIRNWGSRFSSRNSHCP